MPPKGLHYLAPASPDDPYSAGIPSNSPFPNVTGAFSWLCASTHGDSKITAQMPPSVCSLSKCHPIAPNPTTGHPGYSVITVYHTGSHLVGSVSVSPLTPIQGLYPPFISVLSPVSKSE